MARFSFVRFHQSAGARRGVQIVMGVIAAIFIVGAFFSFGGPGSRGPRQREQQTAFIVNGRAINTQQFLYMVKRQQEQMQMFGAGGTGPTAVREVKLSVMDQMTQSIATMQDAEKLGITASGDDIRQAKEEWIQDRVSSIGTGAARAKALTEMNKTEAEFAQSVESEAAAMREDLKDKVIRDKHKETVTADVTLSDEQFAQMFTKLDLRDILIKVDEKAPSSAVDKQGAEAPEASADKPEETAASKAKSGDEKDKESKGHPEAEAKGLIDKVYERAKAGEDYEKLAKGYSEDKFAAAQGGQMALTRGDWHAEQLGEGFFDAAYGLKPGDISEPIRAKDGFHILKLIKAEDTKPKDFDTKKDELREQKLKQAKDDYYRSYCEQLRDAAQVTVEDKELNAYKLDDDGKYEEALTLLNEVVAEEEANAAEAREAERAQAKGGDEGEAAEEESAVPAETWYEIARMNQLLGRAEEAESSFKKAIRAMDDPSLRIEFAKFLKDQSRVDDAVVELQAASKMAYSDQMVHYQLKGLFEEMGRADLAAAEQKQIDEFNSAGGMGGLGGMGGMPLNLGQ